ncbi:MAG: phosphoribosylaminoimidazolesuccinocarboxamide synthase [Candidatus Levybacteria bacterium]|nr:phosphoribosylaminoimidazolesuccinocarboxamide synthase [Candidatus Levybacteria bacterium]
MLQTKTILTTIPNCLETLDLKRAGKKQQGKVRDFYIQNDKRIIITTDRQSAFDFVLGTIPYKGAVLNMLAAFWFSKTKHIIPNHMIAVPDPNVTIARNLTPIPIEMIVRGYMSGVTKTSIWYSYQQGERTIYGVSFPDGLNKNDKLPTPIITPTTHGGGKDGHDERLTKKEIVDKKLISKKIYEQMEQAALELFSFGSKLAEKRGLILVDTKYEFGLDEKGQLMLMDEIHTPDSSRFWIAKTYKKRIAKGMEPENFDKEFLRLWYANKGYTGEGKPPKMTQELIVALAKRYIGVYEKLTGKTFKKFSYPIEERIIHNCHAEFISASHI